MPRFACTVKLAWYRNGSPVMRNPVSPLCVPEPAWALYPTLMTVFPHSAGTARPFDQAAPPPRSAHVLIELSIAPGRIVGLLDAYRHNRNGNVCHCEGRPSLARD